MSESNHTSRSIWFDASSQLKRAGYECIRATGSTRPVDLVAWNKEQIIFLVIRRSRNEGITKFADIVVTLVEMVKIGIPGNVHFWLYRSGLWHRYQIMPGGALPLEWGGA